MDIKNYLEQRKSTLADYLEQQKSVIANIQTEISALEYLVQSSDQSDLELKIEDNEFIIFDYKKADSFEIRTFNSGKYCSSPTLSLSINFKANLETPFGPIKTIIKEKDEEINLSVKLRYCSTHLFYRENSIQEVNILIECYKRRGVSSELLTLAREECYKTIKKETGHELIIT